MEQLIDSFHRYAEIADRSVLNFDDPESVQLAERYHGEVISYALEADADYTARNIEWVNGCAAFDLVRKGSVLCRVTLAVPGKHNILDALAASAAALTCGATPEAVAKGLALFGGAKRRFEYMGKTARRALVYNDYAHHPAELRATLSAAKAFGKRLVAVFQPHTYSRTAAFFDDFSAAFGDADEVIFADIYAAREENIYGVTSTLLAEKTPRAVCLGDRETIAAHLLNTAGEGDLVLILGAGDILKLGSLILSDKANG
jgi:UDP-N-acetylmuramate--alanine ligase